MVTQHVYLLNINVVLGCFPHRMLLNVTVNGLRTVGDGKLHTHTLAALFRASVVLVSIVTSADDDAEYKKCTY